ncbi:MAG: MarR family transcriptional regulator [Saprospiraceae bacterium]|nr:MarR family transcriptional regulator [Saprospiraceae bacterium]
MKHASNIIDAAGYLAISTRLQRLADNLRKDGAMIYQHFGIEFEPKFWPVVYTLSKKSPLGILDLATEIGYAHPSVIALVREMEQKKWIRSLKDKTDSRRRLLSLSPLALDLVAKMEPAWSVIEAALEEICEGATPLLKAISEVEARLEQERFLDVAKRIARDRAEQSVRIIDYEPRHQAAWERLNLIWIAKDFEVEEIDRETLGQPEKYFLSGGGAVLLAEKDHEIIGTVALQPFGNGSFELAKMTVAEKARGLKIGEKLGWAALERARKLGAKRVFLYSNTKAFQAINLYFKLGFRVVPLDSQEFKRANIQMEIVF